MASGTKYLVGVGTPVLEIYDINGFRTDRLLLPETLDPGKIEIKAIPQYLRFKTINPSLNSFGQRTNNKIYGWEIVITMDYSAWNEKVDSLTVKNGLSYEKAGYNVILIPFNETPQLRFNVYYSGNDLHFTPMRNRTNSIGNEGISLEYTTKDLWNELPWYDPDGFTLGIFCSNNIAVNVQ